MKMDKKFWINTGVSLAIVLIGLFAYDTIRTRMAGNTSNAIGALRFGSRRPRSGGFGADMDFNRGCTGGRVPCDVAGATPCGNASDPACVSNPVL